MSNRDQASSSSSDVVGSMGVVRRSELVRLIVDALQTLGFEKSRKLLEQESGCGMNDLNLFMHQITQGKWDESIETLKQISRLSNDRSSVTETTLLIYEQKFFQHLQREDLATAIETLRTEIRPLCNRDRLHELSLCILLKDQGLAKPRGELLEEIKNLPPLKEIVVPKGRLISLVEKVLEHKKRGCVFHNPLAEDLSLLGDHSCGRELIPSRTSQVLDDHKGYIACLEFSHDGQYLASSARDGVLIIWKVEQTRQVCFMYRKSGFLTTVIHISWSPDDLRFITLEQGVSIWDTLSSELIATIGDNDQTVVTCGWHPDGDTIFTISNYKTVTRWTCTGEPLIVYHGLIHIDYAYLEIPRNNREIIIMSDEHTIVIHKEGSINPKYIVENEQIIIFKCSDDGKFCLVSLDTDVIHLYSIDSDGDEYDRHPKLVAWYKGHIVCPFSTMCFGGFEERFVATGSADSKVYIWHRESGELISTLPVHGALVVGCVTWNPTNPHMLASASDDHKIRIWTT